MDSIAIDDILKKTPEKEFKTGGYQIQKWLIAEDGFDKFYLERKHFLSKMERVDYWIDCFSVVFSKKIISDSKRMAFDVFEGHKIKMSMAPSTIALVCIYTSCEFHGESFDAKILDVLEILKREKKKFMFGKEFSGKYLHPVLISKISMKIKERSATLKKELGPEKFKSLKEMWRKLDG
jgi:hypothetical protein